MFSLKGSKISLLKVLLACALFSGLTPPAARAGGPHHIKTVFYILLENRNFTSGTSLAAFDSAGGTVIVGNTAAPYLNSLISGDNDAQVSYCMAYHNVLATASGSTPSIHPSEPNYVWGEAGDNLGAVDDNDPYGNGGVVPRILSYLKANPSVCGQHLTGLMQKAGITWKSYQEDIDRQNTSGGNANLSGNLTTTLLPRSQWTVPLVSFSGSNSSYTNPYNGSHQWGFACKHDGSLFFPDTNGSTPAAAKTGPKNAEVSHYAPLEQLAIDLSHHTVARYNIITPNLYNDMHTGLDSGFTYHGVQYTGDLAQVAQGDNFLSLLVPRIMDSQAYRDDGAIIIWTDETEGANPNDFNHTLTEIVISPLAKGHGYAGNLNYTHSSDVATMQEIFQLAANTSPNGYLNDAANASNSAGNDANTPGFGTGTAKDLSDLFVPGVIPAGIPRHGTAGGKP